MPIITTHYYESTPVLCRDQLAMLGRKTKRLKELMDSAGSNSCQFAHEGEAITVSFANESNATIAIQTANRHGITITYYIEPKQRFAYSIADSTGAITENWQRLANEYLGGDEPSYISIPLLLLLKAIRTYQPAT